MNESDTNKAVPQLSKLRLSARDLKSLASQGFVSEERRGCNRVYFKLRYRCGASKRQKVRYIGSDRSVADAVRCELDLLQLTTRTERELRQLNVEARRILRNSKKESAPLLEQQGLHFYGLEIRKHRYAKT